MNHDRAFLIKPGFSDRPRDERDLVDAVRLGVAHWHPE